MDAQRTSGLHTQLLKGVLDLAILVVLERGPTYGYEVAKRLREAGIDSVGEASVYGTLRRLFDGGALSSRVEPSESGPNRKYYELTSVGRDQLEHSTKTWSTFTDSMNNLLEIEATA